MQTPGPQGWNPTLEILAKRCGSPAESFKNLFQSWISAFSSSLCVDLYSFAGLSSPRERSVFFCFPAWCICLMRNTQRRRLSESEQAASMITWPSTWPWTFLPQQERTSVWRPVGLLVKLVCMPEWERSKHISTAVSAFVQKKLFPTELGQILRLCSNMNMVDTGKRLLIDEQIHDIGT